MSGINYLLDTNFILGILKSSPAVLGEISERKILASACAYSVITRMELLGFPGITSAEDGLIRQKLESFTPISLTPPIEDVVIKLRQTRKIRLPDAIIAATAIVDGVELLTLDQHLLAVVHSSVSELFLKLIDLYVTVRQMARLRRFPSPCAPSNGVLRASPGYPGGRGTRPPFSLRDKGTLLCTRRGVKRSRRGGDEGGVVTTLSNAHQSPIMGRARYPFRGTNHQSP